MAEVASRSRREMAARTAWREAAVGAPGPRRMACRRSSSARVDAPAIAALWTAGRGASPRAREARPARRRGPRPAPPARAGGAIVASRAASWARWIEVARGSSWAARTRSGLPRWASGWGRALRKDRGRAGACATRKEASAWALVVFEAVAGERHHAWTCGTYGLRRALHIQPGGSVEGLEHVEEPHVIARRHDGLGERIGEGLHHRQLGQHLLLLLRQPSRHREVSSRSDAALLVGIAKQPKALFELLEQGGGGEQRGPCRTQLDGQRVVIEAVHQLPDMGRVALDEGSTDRLGAVDEQGDRGIGIEAHRHHARRAGPGGPAWSRATAHRWEASGRGWRVRRPETARHRRGPRGCLLRPVHVPAGPATGLRWWGRRPGHARAPR